MPVPPYRRPLLVSFAFHLARYLLWFWLFPQDAKAGSLKLAAGVVVLFIVPFATLIKLVALFVWMVAFAWWLYLPAWRRERIRRAIRREVPAGATPEVVRLFLANHGWASPWFSELQSPHNRIEGRAQHNVHLEFHFDSVPRLIRTRVWTWVDGP